MQMTISIGFRQSTSLFLENVKVYSGTTTLRHNNSMSNEPANTHITDSVVVCGHLNIASLGYSKLYLLTVHDNPRKVSYSM